MNYIGKIQITITNCAQLLISYNWNSDALNESASDADSPTKRMTRLRARGGVRDKPPIIDDDEDEFFAPVSRKRKTPQTRKPPAERKERIERPRKEPVEKAHHERIDNEREITTDENSLYYIVRHSKNPIAVSHIHIYKINIYICI